MNNAIPIRTSFALFNVKGAIKQPLASSEPPCKVGEDWPSASEFETRMRSRRLWARSKCHESRWKRSRVWSFVVRERMRVQTLSTPILVWFEPKALPSFPLPPPPPFLQEHVVIGLFAHHDLSSLTGCGPPTLLALLRTGHVFIQWFTLLTSLRIFQDDEPEESVASHDTGK